MWCEKCHYGNAQYNFKHCGHCGSTKITNKDPFPSKPIRSIRAMEKRKIVKGSEDEKLSLNNEIKKTTRGDVQARDYTTLA